VTAVDIPPAGTPQREFFKERAEADTGFFCRHVLGMDTDRDGRGNATSEKGKGGIRETGPHGEMVTFLDDESTVRRLLWAPRFSYKSSMAAGFALRNIVANVDISVLLGMHSSKAARERCVVLRDLLIDNAVIQAVWGIEKGPLWEASAFTIDNRVNRTLFTPTLYVGSPDKGLAGGRPNEVIFDDVVDETDVGSELKLAKGIAFVENALALSGKGTRYTMIATPWDEKDAGHFVRDAGWAQCTHLDIGYELYEREDGTLDLRGNGRWPHLTLDHLRGMLRGGMRFEKFSSQFLLRCARGLKARFLRHHFRPAKWNETEHRELTGYLLCDVAPGGTTDGDANVLMYVGLDERSNVFILDLEVGFWNMYEFADKYLTMLQRWQKRVTHVREMWEKGLCYQSYHTHLAVEARRRNIAVSSYAAQRNQTAPGKDLRIEMTAMHFQTNRVHVMDTVPRWWNAGTKLLPLWDPEAEKDPVSKVAMPGGELVQQFVRFPHYGRKDIADTFALIDTLDPTTNQRVCSWVRPASRGQATETLRNPPGDERIRETGNLTSFFDRWSGGR
jgi:hypothetical protein